MAQTSSNAGAITRKPSKRRYTHYETRAIFTMLTTTSE